MKRPTAKEIKEARRLVKATESLIKLHTIHLICGSPPLPRKLVRAFRSAVAPAPKE